MCFYTVRVRARDGISNMGQSKVAIGTVDLRNSRGIEFFDFETHQVPSELLLPREKKTARKG